MDFDKIIDHYGGNKVVFKAITEHIDAVVPFIGAGLSSAFFPLWADLFKLFISEHRFELKSKIHRIENSIDENDFEYTATMLEDAIGRTIFYEKLFETYSDSHIRMEQLESLPVYLMPDLFSNLIITTNYDNVIENVFAQHKEHINPLGFNDTRLLNKISSNLAKSYYILKLHGGFKSNIDDVVLNEESYNKLYGKDGTAIEPLKKLLSIRPLLFIGASLEHDRVFELLKSISSDHSIRHFAIINCERDEVNEKAHKMQEAGIMPLMYPKGEYECVDILLKEVLKIKENQMKAVEMSYYSKDVFFDQFLKELCTKKSYVNSIILFGGISSRLCDKSDIDKLSQWLSKSKDNKLYICYEDQEAAQRRAIDLDGEMLTSNDGLSKDTDKRMREKAENVKNSLDLYDPATKNQIKLIEINVPMNSYYIVVDNEFYHLSITHKRSSNLTISKNNKTTIGKKDTREHIDYMLHLLKESNNDGEINKLICDELEKVKKNNK